MTTLSIRSRSVRQETCAAGGMAFEHVGGLIDNPEGPYAVYFAACHGHPEHEAQIDVTLGRWGTLEPVADHVTFSCVLRSDGAMAVDAPVVHEGDALRSGDLLTRDAALAHRRVAEFWAVVDLLAASDPSVKRSRG